MKTSYFPSPPGEYPNIFEASKNIAFAMGSTPLVGSLLKTLVASKPEGRFLEIGTGTGLATCWLANGMDPKSQLISLDNDPKVLSIAQKTFQKDSRVAFHCTDAAQWLTNYNGAPFDLIFADAWPGKFSHLDQTLGLLKTAGIYIIDDLLPQDNWPKGHQKKVNDLIHFLHHKKDFVTSQLDWATGVMIMVKTGL